MDPPARVVIYDQVVDDDVGVTNRRVAACYTWADQQGVYVLDELLDWYGVDSGRAGAALADAIRLCRRHQAHLLIHSLEVLDAAEMLTAVQRDHLTELLVCLTLFDRPQPVIGSPEDAVGDER